MVMGVIWFEPSSKSTLCCVLLFFELLGEVLFNMEELVEPHTLSGRRVRSQSTAGEAGTDESVGGSSKSTTSFLLTVSPVSSNRWRRWRTLDVEPGEDRADPAEVEERRDAEVEVVDGGADGRDTAGALLPDVEDVEEEGGAGAAAWPDFDRVVLGIALLRR
jgi:hypothetical protein